MLSCRKLVSGLSVAVALIVPSLAAAPSVWQAPACRVVSGPPAVTFTRDEGRTLAPLARPLQGISYTTGLVALDVPNRLIALQDTTLLISNDAGCRFAPFARWNRTSLQPGQLVKGVGARAFAWTDGGSELLRIDGTQLTPLKSPALAVYGFAADSADRARVRLGDQAGALWESTDAGVNWSPLGVAPPVQSGLVYRVSFDPNNLDHAMVGSAVSGAFVTVDGGKTWTPSTGFADDGRANVFNLVVAPTDGQTVYAMGLNLAESDAGAPSEGRHIYVSRNGGFSFQPIVDRSADVVIINGPTMAVDPVDANALYFIFGTSFDNYGTDIYKVDGLTGAVSTTHNAYDRMTSFAFNPAEPKVIYLGLGVEDVSGI
ncbi:MAG: dispase autolysis-inducing protein [Acidobacteriota bacterium]